MCKSHGNITRAARQMLSAKK